MKELIRSNDIVLIGFARSLLEEAGVPLFVADEHMSALEGSIGVFGRRLLVPDDHAPQAAASSSMPVCPPNCATSPEWAPSRMPSSAVA